MPRSNWTICTWTICLTFLCFNWVAAQTLKIRPAGSNQPASNSDLGATPAPSVPLTVPVGMPLKVAVDREIHVRKVGQRVRGRVTEPVYAFDKLVVPAGSEVHGEIAQIETVSKKKRAIAALNADFSPYREVRVDFDELVLADGRRISLQTSVL